MTNTKKRVHQHTESKDSVAIDRSCSLHRSHTILDQGVRMLQGQQGSQSLYSEGAAVVVAS